MLRLVGLMAIALPLIEIAGFIIVGKAIGLLATLGLIVLAALVGMAVLRGTTFSMMGDMRARLDRGEAPGRPLADAVLIMLAGILLIIPGFFGDLVALLLLLPPVRQLIYRLLTRNMQVVTTSYTVHTNSADSTPNLIELDNQSWRNRDP